MRVIDAEVYENCQTQMDALGLTIGSTFQTDVPTKLHVPVVNGRFGLNMLHDPDHPEVTADHLVMFKVARRVGYFTAEYFATAEERTLRYVKPGVAHRVGAVVRELVEPDIFDGYHLRVTETGQVAIQGVQQGELVALPVFDEFPDSASAFVAATYYALKDRAPAARQAAV